MKILNVRAKYIRTHVDTAVQFGDGITGLVGSNETGKSTLATEVPAYLIYGADAVRKTLKGFRSSRAPETRKFEASGDLEFHGVVYHVERSEKTARVTVNGRPVAEGHDPVTKFMTKVAGRTLEEFLVSPVCLQKDVERIASMKPAPRKAFIRRLLGVGRLDDALQGIRDAAGDLRKERDGLAAGLGEREPRLDEERRAGTQVKTAGETLERMQADAHEASARSTEADTALKVSEAVKARHDELTRELAAAEKELADAGKAHLAMTEKLRGAYAAELRVKQAEPDLARLPGLRAERDGLRDARATADERRTLVARLEKLRGELPAADARVHTLRTASLRYDSEVHGARNDAVIVADMRVSALKRSRLDALSRLTAEGKSRIDQATALRKKVESVTRLGAESPCPTCTRVLGDALDTVVRALQDEIDGHLRAASASAKDAETYGEPSDDEVAAEVEAESARIELQNYLGVKHESESAARDLPAARQRVHEIKVEVDAGEKRLAELPEIVFDAGRMTAIETEVRDLEAVSESLTQVRALASQVEEYKAALAAEQERAEAAQDRISYLQAKGRTVRFDTAAHDQLVKNAAVAERDAQAAQVAVARAEEVLRGAQAALETARRALADYDRRAQLLVGLDASIVLHKRSAERLDDFRTAIISQIRPEMEELVSGFISILTDGRHEAATLTDDFQVILHESGVQHEVVSGGCENLVALAMRLAISQMIAERSGDTDDCLILDEPTDGIDDTRRQNVVNLIRSLRNVYRQVIVISHSADVREASDRVIELEFDPAYGTRVMGQPQLAEVA